MTFSDFLQHWQNWVIAAASVAGAIIIALIVHYVIFYVLKRIARNPKRVVEASLVQHGKKPAKWILPLLAVLIALPTLPIPDKVKLPAEHVIGLALIAAIAWILIILTEVVADVIASRYRVDVADNLEARRIRTQTQVLRRIVQLLIIILTIGIMLLTIPNVRAIGASVLASAGVAGIIIGMAMKPTLSNLIAGVQIALTQPIRIEDAVIVEGDWGWIEEINITYVVVRTWDWRRLVLPLSYFIEHPFQNWTKKTAQLIGSVYLYVDFTVPIDELRAELDRLVKSSKLWREEVVVLQVSDVKEYTIELRALADARTAGETWDLRCYIREGLIKYLQEHYPQSLPKTRAELQGMPELTSAAKDAFSIPNRGSSQG
jgi:small-conductance mechanosensitive channel